MTGRDLKRFALLGGLFVLGSSAVIAAVWTPAPHSGGDNAGYLTLAHSLVEGTGYTELWAPGIPPHTKYPPGFPLLLAAVMLGGGTTWAAFKLLSAAATSVALLLVFTWGAERRGAVAGLGIATLTLLSSGWIDASRWILSEPIFLVWTFLGLWAAERGWREQPGAATGSRGWWVVAGLAATAAFLTRSAGLPLAIALLLALMVARRFRAAGVLAAAFAVPAGAWMLWARRGGGEGAYASEFWMVNPYEPDLGTIGWEALPARAWENLLLYGGDVLPAQWWGWVAGGGFLPGLGVVLGVLAGWGWVLRVRREPAGPSEYFLPLYLGLILLWPPVWSGERFLLPLLPLLLLNAGEATRFAALPLGRVGARSLVIAGFLILGVPSVSGWRAIAAEAAACRGIAAQGDVFLCHGPGFREFRDAAAWAGVHLPGDAVVLNRKPRIHYLLGGRRGHTFPLTLDADRFLTEADRLGARYLLLDHVDAVALYYLPAVIQARPTAFCRLVGWGGGDGRPATLLFGILPPEARGTDPGEVEDAGFVPCPADYRVQVTREPVREGIRIPLRVRSNGG